MHISKAESLSRMAVKIAADKQGATDLYGLFSGGVELWYPIMIGRFQRWEALAALSRQHQLLDLEAGFTGNCEKPIATKNCEWGHGANKGKNVGNGQMDFLHMCSTCQFNERVVP